MPRSARILVSMWVACIAALFATATATAAGAEVVPAALPGAPPFPKDLRARLTEELSRRPEDWEPRSRHRRPDGSPLYTNRLALESSPYLLQHAHNPVNWYAWGDEAFETARSLDRPVLVSIGYSTCHWCHVMEEESFDDPEIAELLNAHFVAVKVDREARPDVDAVYMNALRAMGGTGGWPLNVWLTPDRKPFFGGTYFPPADRPGRPGLPRVLRQLHRVWSEDRSEVDRRAGALSAAIAKRLEGTSAGAAGTPQEAWLRAALARIAEGYDPAWGGMRGAPKFPANLPVRLLLRLHRRSGDARALEMAVTTLEKLAEGGIRDQVGGGFHRYATDARWRVPHFEKMLYDNAQLAVAYLEGWQATGREDFARVARQTLDYVAREMTSPRGGFFSATDADSAAPDGTLEEGRYYTWTPGELEAALGAEEAALVAAWFGVTPEGQLGGRSVLHTGEDPAAFAERQGVAPEDLRRRLERARAQLLRVRGKRPPPLRDDKVVVAWNGLMIGAFARGALLLDESAYAELAGDAARRVLAARRDGRLRRVLKGGSAQGPAFLEDYAFLVAGLLDLYEAQPDPRWIREALDLQAVLDVHYAGPEGGAYYRSASDGEALLARERPGEDGALPSGNAVAASNLLRLAAFTGEDRYRERALAIFSDFRGPLAAGSPGVFELLLAVDFDLDTSKEVLLVAPAGDAEAAEPLLAVLRRTFSPNRILSVVSQGEELESHAEVVPLLRYKKARRGRATAYVCENRTCRFPTSDPEVFGEQLAAHEPWGAAGADAP